MMITTNIMYLLSFVIFFLLFYKPIKNFILHIIDNKIQEIKSKSEELSRIVEDSLSKLEKSKIELELVKSQKLEILEKTKSESEIQILKMKMEFDNKIKNLLRNAELDNKNFSNNKIIEIKNIISDQVYNNLVNSYRVNP